MGKIKKRSLRKFLSAVLLILMWGMISACDDSGSKPEVVEIHDLKILQTIMSNTTVKMGHMHEVELRIESKEDKIIEEVSVSVHFIESSDGDTTDGYRQFYAGLYNIEKILPGTNNYKLKVIVPDNIGHTGDYKIVAFIHQNDVSLALDEDENPEEKIGVAETKGTILEKDDKTVKEKVFDKMADDIKSSEKDVELDLSHVSDPDLFMKGFTINEDVFVMFRDKVETSTPHDQPITGRIELLALGSNIPDVRVHFHLEDETGASVGDILLWDKEKNNYESELSVGSLIKYDPLGIAVSWNLPQETIDNIVNRVMWDNKPYTFYAVARVSTVTGEVELTNNEIKIPVKIVPDASIVIPSGTIIDYDKKYSHGFNSKFFRAGIEYGTYASVGVKEDVTNLSDIEISSKFGVWTKAPIKIFFLKGSFWDFSVSIDDIRKEDGNPIRPRQNVLNTKMEFMGGTIFLAAGLANQVWPIAPVLDFYDLIRGSDIDRFSGIQVFDLSVPLSVSFIVGPVPVRAGFVPWAHMGFDAFYRTNRELQAVAIPYIEMGVTASAYVGMGFVEAGLECEVALMTAYLRAVADLKAGLILIGNQGPKYDGSAPKPNDCYDLRLWGKLDFNVDFYLDGPYGRITGKVNMYLPAICKKKIWGVRIPYPCMRWKNILNKVLFRWDSGWRTRCHVMDASKYLQMPLAEVPAGFEITTGLGFYELGYDQYVQQP